MAYHQCTICKIPVSIRSDSNRISIVKYASETSTTMPYSPSPLTVKRGTTVTWINNDFTTHTVTEVTNKFDSGDTCAKSSLQAHI